MDQSKRILGLDIIRALAIMGVLFSHTGAALIQHPLWPKITYSMGVIGVELFFVLSGFLIGQMLIDLYTSESKMNLRQVKNFWVRRWLRTLPNYYLMFVVYFFLHIVREHGFDLVSWLPYFPYLVFLQNFVTPHPSFFIVAWSLSIEEWFYLLFPIVLLLLQYLFPKNKNKAILTSIVLFIIGCTLFRIMLSWNSELKWDDIFRKLVPLRLDSIVIGVLAAYVYNRYRAKWQHLKFYSLIAGIGLLVYLSYAFYSDYLVTGESSFFVKTFFLNFLSIAIALLFPVFSSPAITLPVPVARVITHISIISYSVYLNQEFVIRIVYKFNALFPLPAILLFIVSWGAIFIGGTLQYHYFERPILKKRDKITLPVVNA